MCASALARGVTECLPNVPANILWRMSTPTDIVAVEHIGGGNFPKSARARGKPMESGRAIQSLHLLADEAEYILVHSLQT